MPQVPVQMKTAEPAQSTRNVSKKPDDDDDSDGDSDGDDDSDSEETIVPQKVQTKTVATKQPIKGKVKTSSS
jgi:hypothetical protein